MTNVSTRRAAVAALVVALVLAVAGSAVAAAGQVAGTRVRAHDQAAATVVAASAGDSAGEGRAATTEAAKEPVGSHVAPQTALNPSGIRFIQTSVNNVDEVASSMRANGWVGDPIDVVRMPDRGLTTLDNTSVLAAHEAGINVQARVHASDELLPGGSVGRFTTPKGGAPTSWGDAVLNRIGGQNAPYRTRWPMGSPFTGWNGL